MKTRTDAPHVGTDLSYPPKPDNKGYAKRYWERRAYYFGPHNTPESFMLFGEWRKRLIETGEAPDMKSLKAELRKERPTEEPPKSKWHNVLIAASLVLILIGSNVTTRILSTSPTLIADEEFGVITDDERKLLRGYRQHVDTESDVRGNHSGGGVGDRLAIRLAALLEGIDDGKDASSTGDGS
jgi:hypothetical protein